MIAVDWENLKEEDLKNRDQLSKVFRKHLKKAWGYSAEEAKFAAPIIEEPFARNYCGVDEKHYEKNIKIGSKEYEVYFCITDEDRGNPFEFYTLVDVSTLEEKEWDDKIGTYISATKKFVF